MSVERLERGVLTTNAYTKTQEWSTTSQISTSGQWSIVDNYTIYRRVNMGYTGSGVNGEVWYNSFIFSGCTNNDYPLEYYVKVYTYGTTTLKYESTWIDNNKECAIWMGARSSSTSNSYEIYVRRKADEDGNRGYLVPSDMRPSVAVFKGVNEYDYEEQTLPSDWFQTTTQTIPTYTTQTTMLTTVDYESYLSTLTVPADVRPAIAQLDQLINDLWSLHYIPFVVCFALIMGLAIWLLH